MRKVLKQNSGSTLIELITVMVISTLLIMASAAAISTFYRRYKFINEFVDLQKGAMEALMIIRNGYAMNRGEQFYGVANAKKCEIVGTSEQWGAGNGIKIYPPSKTDLQGNDWITFYRDGKSLRVNYMYNGVQVDSPQYLFPPRQLWDRMEVTKFIVSDANSTGGLLPVTDDNKNTIFRVELEARVKVKDAEQANEIEYKSVSYKTYMVRK